jgi:hypothetical protein
VLALSDTIDLECGGSYDRFVYLNSVVLKAVSDNSGNLVRLQALQQVLTWLLQLPAGQGREVVIDVMRHDSSWLQQLLQCWAAEVQQTGCGVQQAAAAAAERYAAAFGGGDRSVGLSGAGASSSAAGAAGSSRGIGSYLAGLCQLLLQLLEACCKQVAANVGSEEARYDAAEGDNSIAGRQGLLQQLAGDLLKGTAALLLHTTDSRQQQQQQQRCTHAGLWRNALWFNVQHYKAGKGALEAVVPQVQQLAQDLRSTCQAGPD